MPLYRLTWDLAFPNPNRALPDGLLAVGGDLSEARLLLAYSQGIFPWYSEGEPILWWSPDPRMILLPEEFHVSRRFARLLRQRPFQITRDHAFDDVVRQCASVPRPGQNGTWITREMQRAYGKLHRSGYAHSIEVWEGGSLVGGLYGISLGNCFFGESMVSNKPNASKVALAHLVELTRRWGFTLIDCQVRTDHLERMGARDVSRAEFLGRLKLGLNAETRRGSWAGEPI